VEFSTSQPEIAAANADPGLRPVKHATVDRVASIVVTAVPPALLVLAIVFSWGGILNWNDAVVFAVCYLLVGIGVTVGYHRLFTHRSFKTGPSLKAVFGILGSAAAEGAVIEWVATHRQHHRFSDAEGDPHSPHVGHGSGFLGALRGLFHAHIGWAFGDAERADENRYAPDLVADPVVSFVNKTFILWVFLGLAFPFGLGVALTGSVIGGLTGLLWGGAVRIFVLHHLTFSINSLCHFFGRQSYDTGDHSRNLGWLALLTLGEGWHNNHHAFPSSARHGIDRWQPDSSAALISLLERLGLAWDVVRISPDRMRQKALGSGPHPGTP
jgi:stearoyl-CoA desaturase (Delta-9 desaturase)